MSYPRPREKLGLFSVEFVVGQESGVPKLTEFLDLVSYNISGRSRRNGVTGRLVTKAFEVCDNVVEEIFGLKGLEFEITGGPEKQIFSITESGWIVKGVLEKYKYLSFVDAG